MVDDDKRFPMIREAAASFANRADFRKAVVGLIAAKFAPSDLSVLATHESLEIAGKVPGYAGTPNETLAAGLTDEVSFLAPLTVAGIVLLSGGAVAVALAALVGAGLSGMAIGEVLERVFANRSSAEFTQALQAGEVLLWVRVTDPELEAPALRILEEAGGRHVHVDARAAAEAHPG